MTKGGGGRGELWRVEIGSSYQVVVQAVLGVLASPRVRQFSPEVGDRATATQVHSHVVSMQLCGDDPSHTAYSAMLC